MQLLLTSQDVFLNEKLRSTIFEKFINPLERVLNSRGETSEEHIAELKVYRTADKFFELKITLRLPGRKTLFAQNRGERFTFALVKLRKELLHQVRTQKNKLNYRNKQRSLRKSVWRTST